MGVLNLTPDSFSDGGRFLDRRYALDHAEEMLSAGAAIIDVGGESTRPGAASVSESEEIARTIAVIDSLVREFECPVSIDTSRATVMRAATDAGAVLINDVRSLSYAGALEAARDAGVAVCLMHMQGQPVDMQLAPEYADPVAEITAWLADRRETAIQAGIPAGHILVDPGFGFGKTLAHNVAVLRELSQFRALGAPILVGLSRKSMLGEITGRSVDDRLAGSVASATIAALNGASIVRAHDVAATIDAVKVAAAMDSD